MMRKNCKNLIIKKITISNLSCTMTELSELMQLRKVIGGYIHLLFIQVECMRINFLTS